MSKKDIALALSNIVNDDYCGYLYNEQINNLNFDDLFTSFVFYQFEVNERMDIQLVWNYYAKALNECKQNKLSKANYYYQKGEELLNNYNLNEKAKLYLNVYIYPNLAFRKYKENNNEEALELLLLGIKNIEIIQKEYADIYSAKIQQIHNLIRVFFKSNNEKEYFDLNTHIIEHILLEVEPIENKYNLDVLVLKQTKIKYREEMLIQIFSEFVFNQIVSKSESFDLGNFCDSLNEKIIFKDENIYIKKWINVVSLINRKSLAIHNYVGEVLKKDSTFIYFKIYILNLLLNNSYLYSESDEYFQNIKTLTNFLYDQIHDKKILEKIQRAHKIEVS